MKINNVYPWGRSMDEYRRMFALGDADLARRIVGCGDGPAAFNGEWTRAGGRVISCDPLYQFEPAAIRGRIDATAPVIVEDMRQNPARYLWRGELDSPEAVAAARLAAMDCFLADYEGGRASGRYVQAQLPHLPFAGGSFDLALCSHLVFLYSDELPMEFHLEAVREMCRAAGEARIFPLQDMQGRRSAHLEPVMARLEADGYAFEIVPVDYEFQRGANRMLRARGPESCG